MTSPKRPDVSAVTPAVIQHKRNAADRADAKATRLRIEADDLEERFERAKLLGQILPLIEAHV